MGTVPACDADQFIAAMRKGYVVAPLSMATIEEVLAPFERDRAVAMDALATARWLVGFQGMLKTPAAVLEEAIVGYVRNAEAPAYTLPEVQRANVVRNLSEMLAGSAKHDGALLDAVADVRRSKEKWRETMRDRQARALKKAKADGLHDRESPSFAAFWHAPALSFAEAFAARHGSASDARQLGLEGLLAVRPVRLGIGVLLAQIYSHLVPTKERSQLRTPRRSDGYDIWHAILAGAAEIFVTFDRQLADHVELVPDSPGFLVVRSVAELLALLK